MFAETQWVAESWRSGSFKPRSWQECVVVLFAIKRAVEVQVEFGSSDGDLESQEGRVVFREGDALLTGSDGERWAIGRTKVQSDIRALRRREPGPGRCIP